MPGAIWSTMQITLFGGARAHLLTTRGARNVAPSGRQRRKNRVETLHDRPFAADHHAVAALQTPDAAAGSDIDIVDAVRSQFLGAADVVDIVGIAAIDQNVVRLQ